MVNTIDQFGANTNFVHGNMFRVSIQFPNFLGGALATQQMEFHCQSTVIPSGTTEVIEVPFMGSKIKIAGDNTYPDWTVTILNNKDFNIYKTVQRWREFQRSDVLGTRSNDLTYKTIATIEQLDGSQNVIFTEVLVGLWPQLVGDITLGAEENNTVEVFDVTFSMDYILPETV